MEFVKEEVLRLAEEVLGKSPDGVYASKEFIYADCSDEEIKFYDCLNPDFHPIYTNLEFTRTLKEDSAPLIKDRTYSLHNGVTKVVVIPKNKPYVIKFPITGLYAPKKTVKGDFFLEREANLNAIEEEIKIYNNSPDCLKEVLMPLIYVGMVGKVPIYVQEKFSETAEERMLFDKYDELRESGNEIFDRLECYLDEEDLIDGVWLERLIETYEEKAIEVIKKIGCWPMEKDLHDGNYGYDKDNNPRIWDYAGYSDWEWWE